MILKLTKADGWDLGEKISTHLLDIRKDGTVARIIDLDQADEIVEASPTVRNPYGAEDHAPLDMACDWSRNMFSESEFESLWHKAMK
jgi:hypothetical protein